MSAKNWLAFFLAGLIWSSSFMWIKIGLTDLGPVTLVAYRATFGLLFGVGLIFFTRTKMLWSFKQWMHLFTLGTINIAIPFYLINWGERLIDSSIAAILNSTVPLIVIFGSHLLLEDDKMTLPKVMGLIVGFTGVVVLLSGDIGKQSSSLIGSLAVLLAAISYAGSAIYARKYTQNIPTYWRGIGPLVSAALSMWTLALFLEAPLQAPAHTEVWVAVIWLGMLGSGLAMVLLYYLIHEIGPTRASMTAYLFPLGGTIMGVAFLHEAFTWRLGLGAILVSASLIISNWRRGQTKLHP